MSEIPFINRLGDEIERAITADAARHKKPRRMRPRAIVVLVLLAVGGVASAATFIGSTSTDLAANDIVCYGSELGGVTVTASEGRSPIEVCAEASRHKVPASRLVACAGGSGPNGPYVMVYVAHHPDECRRRGDVSLPGSYRSAQARVSALGQALVAVENSRDCVPVAEFAAQARGVLDRLGWSSWRVRVERVGRDGCGTLAEGGAGKPAISGSLEAGARTLVVSTRPPRSLLGAERSVWAALNAASGKRCLTPTALENYARSQIVASGLGSAFAITREPRFVGLGGGRQRRYEQGCAVMAEVTLAAGLSRIDVAIYSVSGRASAPQGDSVPQSWYR